MHHHVYYILQIDNIFYRKSIYTRSFLSGEALLKLVRACKTLVVSVILAGTHFGALDSFVIAFSSVHVFLIASQAFTVPLAAPFFCTPLSRTMGPVL